MNVQYCVINELLSIGTENDFSNMQPCKLCNMAVCTLPYSTLPWIPSTLSIINQPTCSFLFSGQLMQIHTWHKSQVHQSANYRSLAYVITLLVLETDYMVFLANCSLCMFYSTLQSLFCLNRSCNIHICIYIFYFILFSHDKLYRFFVVVNFHLW